MSTDSGTYCQSWVTTLDECLFPWSELHIFVLSKNLTVSDSCVLWLLIMKNSSQFANDQCKRIFCRVGRMHTYWTIGCHIGLTIAVHIGCWMQQSWQEISVRLALCIIVIAIRTNAALGHFYTQILKKVSFVTLSLSLDIKRDQNDFNVNEQFPKIQIRGRRKKIVRLIPHCVNKITIDTPRSILNSSRVN